MPGPALPGRGTRLFSRMPIFYFPSRFPRRVEGGAPFQQGILGRLLLHCAQLGMCSKSVGIVAYALSCEQSHSLSVLRVLFFSLGFLFHECLRPEGPCLACHLGQRKAPSLCFDIHSTGSDLRVHRLCGGEPKARLLAARKRRPSGRPQKVLAAGAAITVYSGV